MAPKPRVSVGDWPRLTRYYGISPFELVRMPRWLTQLYADKLSELEAEEAIRASTISTLPHMGSSDRDRILRSWRDRAGVPEVVETVDVDTEGGKAVLAGLGIGLVVDSTGSDDG